MNDIIELRLLRYFVAVAEHLHFGRAAESLGIAQPPLSIQIQQLERKLGATLLHRDRRHVALTEPGTIFLDHARRILSASEEAVEEVRRAATGKVGRLRIGAVSSATYEDLVSIAIRRFREENQGVVLSLQEMTTSEQIESLQRGEIDIGFVRPPAQGAGIQLEVVKREPLLAALPSTHRLAKRRKVRVKELAGEAWVTLPPELGLGFHDLVLGVCLKAGFTPSVSQVAFQIHTMVGLVAAGLGVTLVPASVASLHREGVTYCRLADATAPVETAAAYLQASDSPILANFLKIMRKTARGLTKGSQPAV